MVYLKTWRGGGVLMQQLQQKFLSSSGVEMFVFKVKLN